MRLITIRQVLALTVALIVGGLAAWAAAAGNPGASTALLALLLAAVLAVMFMYRNDVRRLDRHVRSLNAPLKSVDAQIGSVDAQIGELHRAARRAEATLETLAKRDPAADLGVELEKLEATSQSRHRAEISRLHRLSYSPVIEVQALLQLQQLVPEFARLPSLAGWAIDPSNLLVVARHLTTTRPALVVECGSGSSTVWVASLLRAIGRGRIVSLEGEAEYAEITREMLQDHGLEDVAEVRDAPLLPTDEGGTPWYDAAAHADLSGIDVLIVDGPPQATGKLARYPALPRLHSALSPNAVLFLDDAARPDERETIDRWVQAGLIDSVRHHGGLAEMRATPAGSEQQRFRA